MRLSRVLLSALGLIVCVVFSAEKAVAEICVRLRDGRFIVQPCDNAAKVPVMNRAGECSVTIALPDFDFSLYSMVFCGLHSENLNWDEPAFDSSGVTLSVPAGDYFLSAVFYPMDGSVPVRMVVRENVRVDSDMEVAIASSEATVPVKVSPCLPGGERVIPPLTRRIEGTLDREVIGEGNVTQATDVLQVYSRRYGGLSTQFSDWYRIAENDGSVSETRTDPKMLISPVSDDFVITYNIMGTLVEGPSFFSGSAGTVGESVDLATSAGGYVRAESSFVYPADSATGTDVYCFAMNAGFMTPQTNELFLYNCSQPAAYICFGDYGDVTGGFWTVEAGCQTGDDENPVALIGGFPMKEGGARGPVYPGYNLNLGTRNLFMSLPGGGFGWGNPAAEFTRDADRVGVPFGASTPFLAFLPAISRSDGFDSFIKAGYVGLCGERRLSDLEASTLSLKFNGEELPVNAAGLEEWSWGWFEGERDAGVYEMTMSNSNTMVDDDIAGTNLTRICFDTSTAGMVPPVLTKVEFVNGLGMVTNVFDNPEDGDVTISGGQFHAVCDEDGNSWLELGGSPETVVEYAPHGSDDFVAMDFALEPEDAPGFGYVFKGRMEDIAVGSPTGWFDLRISMADGEGNSMVQTFSPAFKIRSLASIGGVSADWQGADNLYDLMGRHVCHPVDGSLYIAGGRLVLYRNR